MVPQTPFGKPEEHPTPDANAPGAAPGADAGAETETRPQEEPITVKDRRRFAPDGTPRQPDEPVGDDAVETVGFEPAAEDAAAERDHWRERALAAEQRLQEFAEGFRRYKDEHDAIRSRLERDVDLRVHESLARAVSDIVDVLDNLERALEHAEEGPLSAGVRLVHKQILEALANQGLERIEVVGRPFDPEVAEAVDVVPISDPAQSNIVLEEVRPGYRFRERVLRPAQVRVGQAPPES